jgi:DNA-binding NtrC family response regulator
MKLTNVLLLDLNPACELSDALRGIIESDKQSEIKLQLESVANIDHLIEAARVWPELVSRIKPAVVFLISPWNILKQIKPLFQSIRKDPPEPQVVVVSDTDAPQEMYEMIKLGAADFITPPLTPAGILPRLWRLMEQCSGDETSQRADPRAGQDKPGLSRLIGESPSFLEAVNKIPLIAELDASVLISGETGVGKELCARAIHQFSRRSNRPFIPINCAAIPTELVENELFGHERGAYTNASSSQIGLIQEADGGTLFLDEIDSLPLMAQAKLLRFLQEKEFKPLGSTKLRQADVRIITATNIDVEEAVREKRVRQDLYYRLNIIPIKLPPLRERREDILLLAEHFLAKYVAKFQKRVSGFSPEAKQRLLLYRWPGNVRELEHAVERATAFTTHDAIQVDDLALSGAGDPAKQVSFKTAKAKVVVQFERTYLQALLMAYDGNVTRAAEAAKKDRGAFCQLLRKHRINANSFRSAETEPEND